MIADQVKGTYDITGGNYVSYIQAQQRREANLDIFAEASVMGPATQGIYTMPDSKVTNLADLKGKTVAINAPKNILYLLAASMMAEQGINPSSVKFANVPFPEMATALASGAIDAALLPEPFASDAEEAQGAVPLVGPGPGRDHEPSRSRATWSPSSGPRSTRARWPRSTGRWSRASSSRTTTGPTSSRR